MDVLEGLRATGVELLVADGVGPHDVPLSGDVVFLQVHAQLYVVVLALLVNVPEVDLQVIDMNEVHARSRVDTRFSLGLFTRTAHHVTVVRPRAELEVAGLIVEREVLDVDVAGRHVYCRRVPHHLAGVVQLRLRHDSHFVVAVGAAGANRKKLLFLCRQF